jgi:hypothetical protein
MKLIDILVEETIKNGWSWPERANCITQDRDREIMPATCQSSVARFDASFNRWFLNGSRVDCFTADVLASDYETAIITREQYEAALAAKNDGWIDWGGGECPVPTGTLVDVKWRDGRIDDGIPAKISHDLYSSRRNAIRWRHHGNSHDIIAYRLHNTQEAAQDKVDDVADLNECIGQDAAQIWNGEGLPPVGCECERSWACDEWQRCKILFTSNQLVVIKLKESGREDSYNIGDVIFRPIRSEADKKRE